MFKHDCRLGPSCVWGVCGFYPGTAASSYSPVSYIMQVNSWLTLEWKKDNWFCVKRQKSVSISIMWFIDCSLLWLKVTAVLNCSLYGSYTHVVYSDIAQTLKTFQTAPQSKKSSKVCDWACWAAPDSQPSDPEVKQTPDNSSFCSQLFETWLNLTTADKDLMFLRQNPPHPMPHPDPTAVCTLIKSFRNSQVFLCTVCLRSLTRSDFICVHSELKQATEEVDGYMKKSPDKDMFALPPSEKCWKCLVLRLLAQQLLSRLMLKPVWLLASSASWVVLQH